MQNRELKFIIRVQNEAKAALTRLRGQLSDVGAGGEKTAKGARSAAQGQKQLAAQAQQTTKTLQGQVSAVQTLARGMKLLVGFFGIREAINLADAYTNMTNRLKTLAGGPEEAAAALGRLDRIATASRGSLDATVSVYQRVTQAQDALGTTTEQTFQFVENLNKAVAVSGASAIEARSGLLQLGQGLGSGVLQGQELNAVLESMPFVARLIADEVGVKTPGALKVMASEGKVQSRAIIDALLNAKDEVEDKYSKMAPTIGQAFQETKNQITLAFGELVSGAGITSVVAQGVFLVAENMRGLVRVAKVGLVVFAAYKTFQAFGFIAAQIGVAKKALIGYIATTKVAIRQQVGLNASLSGGAASSGIFARSLIGLRIAARNAGRAIMSIPLIGWALAAVAAVVALVELSSGFKVSKDSASTLGDVFGVAAKKVGNEFAEGAKKAGQALLDFVGIDIDFSNLDWREMALGLFEAIDEMWASVSAFAVTMGERINMGVIQTKIFFIDLYNGMVAGWINPAIQAVVDFVNRMISNGAAIVGGIGGALEALPDIFSFMFQNAVAAAATILDGFLSSATSALSLIPGIDITPSFNLAGYAGGFQALPDIAGRASAGASAAFNANLNTFDAPTVALMEVSATDAAVAAGSRFNAAWDNAMVEGRAASGMLAWWTPVFDDAEELAKDRAFAAGMEGAEAAAAGADAADTTGGKGGKATKAASDALKKLRDNMADLVDEIFPARARVAELNEKMQLLSQIKLSDSDMVFAIQQLEEAYGKTGDAIGSVVRDIEDQMRVMALSGNASEDLAFRIDLERAAREDGLNPLDADTKSRIDNAVAMNSQIRAVEIMKDAQADLQQTLSGIGLETSLLGVGLTDSEVDRITEIENYRLQLMTDRGIAGKALADLTDEELRDYAELNDMVDRYADGLRRLESAQRAQRTNSLAGLREGVQQWSDNAADLYGQVSQLATQTLGDMTTVLTDFVTTGKASFGDFARSAIRSITQIIVKMLLLRAIQGIGNAIVPGLGTTLTSVGTNHKGGMAGRGGGSTMVSPALFANAKRLHSGGMVPNTNMAGIGGLKQGEVPIVALNTERVLNPEETAAYNAGLARNGAVSAALGGGGRLATGGNPQQIVLAPSFHNDFSGITESNDLSADEAKSVDKAFEAEAQLFMERWVMRESKPGGRLAPRR